MRKIGNVGDKNPIDYGGGYVFSAPGQEPWVEYFYGLEDYVDELRERYGRPEIDADEIPDFKVQIYRVDLSKDVKAFLRWYDWIDWESVADFTGLSVRAYTSPRNLRTAQDRANAVWDAANYYGWHEFDQYPLSLTLSELQKRWD